MQDHHASAFDGDDDVFGATAQRCHLLARKGGERFGDGQAQLFAEHIDAVDALAVENLCHAAHDGFDLG